MSSTDKSVQRNFFLNFIFTVSNLLFPLIAFPYASRILLPEGTGKVAFVTSIVSYFTMVGMLGIPIYGIRACAKVRSDKVLLSKTVVEIFILNFITMFLSMGLYLLAVLFIPRLAELQGLFFLNTLSLLFNLFGFDWLYKALEEYEYITNRGILLKGVALLLLFVLVKEKTDYYYYSFILLLASTGSYIFNFINLRKIITIPKKESLDFRRHFKPTLTFFLMAVATTIYSSLDAIMLGFMSGDTAVGYYNAAINIKNVLLSLITSLGAVLLPRLSVYIQQNKTEEFRKLSLYGLRFVTYISIPMVLYFILFAEEGVYFISGLAYEGAILPMQIVMPTLFLVGISNLLGIQILVPLDKEVAVVQSVSIGAIINLILNALCIPKYGPVGAAIGTLVAEIFVTVYQIYFLRSFLKGILTTISWKKILLSTFLSGMITVFVMSLLSISSIFLTLVTSSLVFIMSYLGILVLLRDSVITSLLKGIIFNNETL